jgi:hypothetical protein
MVYQYLSQDCGKISTVRTNISMFQILSFLMVDKILHHVCPTTGERTQLYHPSAAGELL